MVIKVKVLIIIAWCALLGTTFAFTQRTASESLSGSLDFVNAVRGGLALVALIIILVISSKYKLKVLNLKDPLSLFLLYSLFALMSTIWSFSPIVTYAKAQEICLALLVIHITFNMRNSTSILKKMFQIVLIILLCLIFYSFIGYVLGIEGFYSGNHPWTHNFWRGQVISPLLTYGATSFYAALLALIFLHRFLFINKKFYNLLLVLLFIFISLLSYSRTSVISLIIGIFILLFLDFRRSKTRFKYYMFFVFIITIGPIIYTGANFLSVWIKRGQTTEDVYEFNGRVEMWRAMLQQIKENPFLGSGFGIGSRVLFLEKGFFHGATISSVHNGPLEVLGGVGIIGFLLWVIAIISSIIFALRNIENLYSKLLISMLPAYLLMSTMHTILGGWFSIPMSLFFILLALSRNNSFLLSEKRRGSLK
ncbi:hypothetical protein GTHT12_02839 [Geobacillus thermodenitrificans]|uniref:O-antigen ligase family protein n=1 Tax=Geobacillus thermodenitrificans TaxID=33940 RepID=UPI000A28FBB0|nr:O-antigen ligase family protein [Geobacillus thermodenitrificans]ARP44335.1 hypothetical protein GTHT12_02839 [Geobacillus thermodenitrificans]